MTEEEMRSKMEFIVEHQAKFSAEIEKLNELHAQADARLTRLENVVVRLANHTEERFITLAERMESGVAFLNEKMGALAESQVRLADSLAHTDQRLDTLIDIIRQERNGRSQG